MRIRKGDWVRFYCDGRLVIGQVEYVDENLSMPMAYTDLGAITIEHIREVRAATPIDKSEGN